MDVTIPYLLYKISTSNNRKHFRTRKMIERINLIISNYRLTAMTSRGFIREFCNREANYLESNLTKAMNGFKS